MNDRYLDEAWAVTLSGKRAPILTHTCRGFAERFCGLMLKREVPEACGLYFPNCRSIHTCMMRVPIDVVWVREDEPGLLEVGVARYRPQALAVLRGAARRHRMRRVPGRVLRPGRPAGQDRPPGTRGNRRFRPQCRRLPV